MIRAGDGDFASVAEQHWRDTCAVIANSRKLSHATVVDLSKYASDLRKLIPSARLEAIDAERLARARR